MDIQQIVSRINENSRLLSACNISEIDRDILLEDLRSLYLLAKGMQHTRSMVEPVRTAAPETVFPPAKEGIKTPFIHQEPEVKPVVEAKPIIEERPIIEPQIVVEEKSVVEYKPLVEESPIVEQKPIEKPEPIVEKKEVVQQSVQHTPEPLTLEFVQEEAKAKPATSLNDIFAGEERSLNERLGVQKKPALNDQAGRKDLRSMIDFNKQYVLTNELFKGDSQAFQNAISRINDSQTIEAAFEYIKTDLLPRYRWSGEMQSARLFDKLVRQKFGL